MRLRFTKMHGLGNDFVVLDGVSNRIKLSNDKIKKIADRNFGIGCDQVLLVEPPQKPNADFHYRIFNQDGGEVEHCGNGARCFAIFVREKGLTQKNSITVETASGLITLDVLKDNQVTVNMGAPIFKPKKIPFDAPKQALTYELEVGKSNVTLSAVSMGNPHAVMLVDDVDKCEVEKLGPQIESHARFPNKVNAGFLQIVSKNEGKLRVFERGVGETLACGTGACAAMVAGRLQKHFGEKVRLHLPGGTLIISWAGGDAPVFMTGPATTVFHGQIKI